MTIRVPVTEPVLISVTDITYAHVPFWGGFQPLKLSLTLPKHRERAEPRPLLVWVCGGGFEMMDKDIWMPEMQFFARSGYAVASIEYRTHNIRPFPALIEDAKAAVRFLRAHAREYGIDPERIAMMGESAGGYIASMLGVTGHIRDFDVGEHLEQSSAIQLAVNIYGRTRQVLGWQEKIAQGRPRNTTELLMNGRPEDIPEVYERATPSTYIRGGLPPFLLLHGTEDKAVPLVQNDLLYEDLVKAGTDVDYYIVEGAGHGGDEFYQPEVKKIILEFMDRHLNREEGMQ